MMIREDMKFDVRTLKYRLRRNEVTQEELQEHLDSLPDEADEAETTQTQFVGTFEGRNYRQ
jgi:hypothetical protein